MRWWRRIWGGDSDPATVRYWVRFPAAANYRLPSTFDIKQFKGLLLCQVVESDPMGTAAAVESLWAGKQSYDDQQGPFCAAINRSPATGVGAYERDVRTPSKSVWAHLDIPHQVLIHALAVLGAVVAIHAYYGSLFAGPQVSFSCPQSPAQIAVGDTQSLALTFRNTHRAGVCGVEVTAVRILDSTGAPTDAGIEMVGATTEKFATIESGGFETMQVIGRGMKPGHYFVQVNGRKEMGLLRCAQTFEERVPVQVWHRATVLGKPTVQPSGDRCTVTYAIEAGAAFPGGLTGEASLLKEPGVTIERAYWRPGKAKDDVVPRREVPGDEVTKILWTTDGSQQPFTPQSLILQLTSDTPKSDEQWRTLVDRIRIGLYVERGKP